MSTAAPMDKCPDGTTVFGPCNDNGLCPSGYSCTPSKQCCPTANITGKLNRVRLWYFSYNRVIIPSLIASDCNDKIHPATGISDCPVIKLLCNVGQYFDLMTEECPKTCQRCPVLLKVEPCIPGSITNCVDLPHPKTGKSDCTKRKDLCNVAIYRQVMRVSVPLNPHYLLCME
ncbi:unnamed protein product [Strongylus vulgaris]|uniref:ShKT domain-containing protein n=1 Tax=Strongylus vulgaris TaxID=40348 RepID=A0A3P7JH66_STRVU|nr:unnamed protein product [Strongylus vulgaris]